MPPIRRKQAAKRVVPVTACVRATDTWAKRHWHRWTSYKGWPDLMLRRSTMKQCRSRKQYKQHKFSTSGQTITPERRCPIGRLPDEIFANVMSHVGNKESLLCLSLVSKRIGAIAQAELYRNITIENSDTNAGNAKQVADLLCTLHNVPELAKNVRHLALGEVRGSLSEEDAAIIAKAAVKYGLRDELASWYEYTRELDSGTRITPILDEHFTRKDGTLADKFAQDLEQDDLSEFLSTIITLILFQVPNIRELQIVADGIGPFFGIRRDLVKVIQARFSRLKKLKIMGAASVDEMLWYCRDWPLHIPSICDLSLIGKCPIDFAIMLERFCCTNPHINKLRIEASCMTLVNLRKVVQRYPNVSHFILDCTSFPQGRGAAMSDVSREFKPWSKQLKRLEIRLHPSTLKAGRSTSGPDVDTVNKNMMLLFKDSNYDGVKVLICALGQEEIKRNDLGILSGSLHKTLYAVEDDERLAEPVRIALSDKAPCHITGT